MRIAHLSRIRGAADGGISLIIEQLSAAQASMFPCGHSSVTWFAPPDDLNRSLRAFGPDLVHVHGLWSAPNRLLARRRLLPAVVAPQGMLDSWAMHQKPIRKRLAWWLFEQANLTRCGAVQAVSPVELHSVRERGIRAPVAILPNAVELPRPELFAGSVLPSWQVALPQKHYLLFLSRFHSKKGIDVLLRAWQDLASCPDRTDWHLVLAGYGDQGALARRVREAQQCGELEDVTVIGPVFGSEKTASFLAASAFVLPSHSEGLPMAALEAMAHRLPCILSPACNIPEAFTVGAALSAEPELTSLVSAMRQLFRMTPPERMAMGEHGYSLVARQFSWKQVAEQTAELYRWILGGGDRPGFVELG